MVALGALAGLFSLHRLSQRWYPEFDSVQLSRLFVACYVSGYFGARGLSIIIEVPNAFRPTVFFSEIFRIGSMTFYGGFVLGFLAGLIYVRWRRWDVLRVMDLAMPCVFVGLAIGRVGCFLNGDDYGRAVEIAADGSWPWYAVIFPNLGDSQPRIMTQLIESVAALGLVVLAMVVTPRFIRLGKYGYGGALGILLYAIYRFFAEFLRGDERGWVITDVLSPAQMISICAITAVTAWFLTLSRQRI